jgi:hypothetical protein
MKISSSSSLLNRSKSFTTLAAVEVGSDACCTYQCSDGGIEGTSVYIVSW